MEIRTQSFRTWRFLAIGSLALTLSACSCLPKGQADLDVGLKQRGIASWYGSDFHGWATASGEIYNMEALTGAHRTLPLGTVVRVTNVVNGKQVRLRINDRGPYKKGRIADLSYGAAKAIEMVDRGLAAVQLEVVGHHEADDWNLSLFGLGLPSGSPARSGERVNREVGKSKTGLPHALSKEARRERGHRYPPGDMVPERRARRVTTILEADEGVTIVAILEWT